jgi:GTP-binding protein
MTATVAIVGRPNVGKSTLFNRLVGKRLALVDDRPGVTRDWREGPARLGPLAFRALDTAGLEDAAEGSLAARMQARTEAALAGADLVILVVDARAGITPLDRHFAAWLRRRARPVVLAVNKAEGRIAESAALEAYELGLGEPVAISAEHGEGLAELYQAIVAALPAETGEAAPGEAAPPLRVAIVGRPNVGKSTLVNRLLGAERMVTGPEAGITRDAVAVPWRWQERAVELIDTAGIRRRMRVSNRLETLSAGDAFGAIAAAEIVVLVVDATEPMAKQDLAIAGRVAEEGRALVLAANKWDLVAHPRIVRRQLGEQLEAALAQLRGVPVCPLSALTGKGVAELMDAVADAETRWSRRLSTAALNRWLEETLAHHPPPLARGRPVRIRFVAQVAARPPTFALFVNRPRGLTEGYRRYLANSLRAAFGFGGVPIRFVARSGRNPYVEAS